MLSLGIPLIPYVNTNVTLKRNVLTHVNAEKLRTLFVADTLFCGNCLLQTVLTERTNFPVGFNNHLTTMRRGIREEVF